MKILMITTYVTLEGRKEFERSKTGFGYMVFDIARAVAVTEHVDLFAAWSRGNLFVQDKVYFLPRSLWLFIRYIFGCVSLSKAFKTMTYYTGSFGTRLRFIYCWLLTGYLGSVLKQGNYDIVHIHGCSPLNDLWMEICRKHSVKYIITLHGLDSFSDSVKLEAPGKQYERDLLNKVVNERLPLTVISTGIKSVVEGFYGKANIPNLDVVCNSFNIVEQNPHYVNIRGKYNIPINGKILLYVGNVSKNKNQMQMAEVFELLPENTRLNTWVLFCGGLHDGGVLEKYVNASKYKEHLILCGTVKKQDLYDYYRQSDGVILLSIAEGFGLSLAEGMYFGNPCAMFEDMDAFPDLYDPCAVVPIHNRDNNSVAEGVAVLLDRTWNKERIKQYSLKFNSESMAFSYIKVYKKYIGDER